ncbi:MAG: DNA gyrase C-terminal beta-propeller domain-containing protein, partial [Demequina sp.]|uniref:DNA gyrase C-terminal beta-propeller domain-containing protein n=1 Tax=Demequina sp. TaxID=2050685 RepID=UPI003A840995
EVDGSEVDGAENAVTDGPFSFVVTELGYAKRTAASAWDAKHRGGLGVKVGKLTDERGDLVGALLVDETDEVLVIMESGKVVRSNVAEVPAKGRNTMGVIFAKPGKGDKVIGIARNVERKVEEEVEAEEDAAAEAPSAETPAAAEAPATDES